MAAMGADGRRVARDRVPSDGQPSQRAHSTPGPHFEQRPRQHRAPTIILELQVSTPPARTTLPPRCWRLIPPASCRRKTDVRSKPSRPKDQPPEGFVTWSHTLPVFVQGDSSRLAEIKRNPTKGSRGAKKAEADAQADAAAATAATADETSPVPDQPTPPPELKDVSPPRPVKRLKLTMKSVDQRPQLAHTPPPAAPLLEAVKKEDPSATKARARLEVDQSLSGDVVDEKGVLRSFAAPPPAGTDFRRQIKWGRTQG